MQIFILIIVIAECLILGLLAFLRKITEKQFALIALITAVACIVACVFVGQKNSKVKLADAREYAYITARLLDENYTEEALVSLGEIVEINTGELPIKELRGLVLNLNESYSSAKNYLVDSEEDTEMEIYIASKNKKPVSEDITKKVVGDVIDAVDATPEEETKWEVEMKLRFLTAYATEEEKKDIEDTDSYTQAKVYIYDDQYRLAFQTISSAVDELGIKGDILLAEMYLRNYNQNTRENADKEYDEIWARQTKADAEYNRLAVEYSTEKKKLDEAGAEKDDYITETYKEYKEAIANRNIVSEDERHATAARALNYMKGATPNSSDNNYAYQLEMAYLYFRSDNSEAMKGALDKIFCVSEYDDKQWLSSEIQLYRESYIEYLSNPDGADNRQMFDNLMSSLFSGMFEYGYYSDFREKTEDYLREIYGGVLIGNVDYSAYPEITLNIAVTKPDIELTEEILSIHDTGEEITNFTISEKEITDLTIAFVLDNSGSMSGSYMQDSKEAIKRCASSLDDFVKASLIVFDNDAEILCDTTYNMSTISAVVDTVEANGGTDAVEGLKLAWQTLQGVPGKKVIILLSDGYSNEDGLDEILSILRGGNIPVYSIGLQGCDEQFMRRIAVGTDGVYIPITDSGKLDSIYKEIQASLTSTMFVTYDVSGDEVERNIKINVKDTLIEARKNYVTDGSDKKNHIQNVKVSYVADYFRQNGGSMGGAR